MTSKQVAILVTVLGATHVVARPLLGVIGTKGSTVSGKQVIYAVSVALSGLITLVSMFFETFITQIVFVVVFGIANGKVQIIFSRYQNSNLTESFRSFRDCNEFVENNLLCLK